MASVKIEDTYILYRSNILSQCNSYNDIIAEAHKLIFAVNQPNQNQARHMIPFCIFVTITVFEDIRMTESGKVSTLHVQIRADIQFEEEISTFVVIHVREETTRNSSLIFEFL